MMNNTDLKYLIQKAGTSQSHIAILMRKTPEYISMIFNNKREAKKLRRKIIWYLNECIKLNRRTAA